jgi:pimeloyl-ACP methyl ester carboxylesterase
MRYFSPGRKVNALPGGPTCELHGTSPEAPDLARISAPVLGLYGGDDARVVATVGPAETEMKKLGKTYETHVYDGAGHGFLRAQTTAPAPISKRCRAPGRARWPFCASI